MSINKTYAVFGLGRYGAAVAKELRSNGAEVIAIDKDEKIIESLIGEFPVCRCADVTDPLVLEQLGISSVDTVIISMASNLEASVLTTMLCKEAGVKEIIVKCGSEMNKRIFESMGADKVFFPEDESGKRLAKNLLSSNFFDIAALSEDISVMEIGVPKKWAGKSFKDLDIRKNHFINVIAIIKDSRTMLVTNPDVILEDGVKLVVVGKKADIQKLK